MKPSTLRPRKARETQAKTAALAARLQAIAQEGNHGLAGERCALRATESAFQRTSPPGTLFDPSNEISPGSRRGNSPAAKPTLQKRGIHCPPLLYQESLIIFQVPSSFFQTVSYLPWSGLP